jgi:serine/threonine protein kinase
MSVIDTDVKSIKSIDKYEIQEVLGSGSFGITFRVAGPDGNPYALKWVPPGAPNEAPLRFENEIWALGKLDHPSIPRLKDTGQFRGRPYLVESLAEGTPLRQQIREQRDVGGTMPQMKVLDIVGDVLGALSHMNERGIYHRDVKDDNIIASPSADTVTLIDFGYCRGIGQPAEVPSPTNVGALRYAPPSKLQHSAFAHETHDVFAIGVLGYLLLTNYYPWDILPSEDGGDLQERMMTRPLFPIHYLNILITTEISAFVSELLVIDDNARPTASEAKGRCDELQTTLAKQFAEEAAIIDSVWSERAPGHIAERLSAFPQHLTHVARLVTRAHKVMRIMVDCVDHGGFSDPELHNKVIRAIEDARSDATRPELRIHLLLCGRPAPISATSPYAGRDFETDLISDDGFRKVFDHYCEYHGILESDKRPKTNGEFHDMLMASHNEFMARLRKAKVAIEELPDELARNVATFFWVQDSETAVFSFTHPRASRKDEFFRTHDRAFLDWLMFVFDDNLKKLSNLRRNS